MFDLYILASQCGTITIGLICLRRRGPVVLWLLLILKLLAVFNEYLIAENTLYWWGISRNVCYNIFALVDISCWCVIFYFLFPAYRFAKQLTVLFWFTLMLVKSVEIWQQGWQLMGVYSLGFFCAGAIFFSLIYFARVLQREDHDIKTDYGFWICCAAISFHPVLLVNLLTLSDGQYWKDSFAMINFDILLFVAVFLFNIFLCISFITYYRFPRGYRANL
jgi:hypothetical protein